VPRLASLALLTLLAACSREQRAHKADKTPTDAAAAPPPRAAPIAAATLRPLAPAGDLTLLSPADHLVRVALVLAGRRPTDAEFAAVRRDPSALGGVVDTYLDGPTFGEVVRDMWHEVLLLRVEGQDRAPALRQPASGDRRRVDPRRQRGAAPPDRARRHARPTVRRDRHRRLHHRQRPRPARVGRHRHAAEPRRGPARRLAQASSGTAASRWPASSRAAPCGLRHPSNGTNLHRGQAELIADALLCSGFLARDVPLFNNIDLSDEDVVKEALVREPGCVSCHQTLDPLASHLFGFQRIGPNTDPQGLRQVRSHPKCIDEERGNCYPVAEYRDKQAEPVEEEDRTPARLLRPAERRPARPRRPDRRRPALLDVRRPPLLRLLHAGRRPPTSPTRPPPPCRTR
jgi:hypothetical protein